MLTRDGIAQIIQYYGDSRETCADALMALFKQELAARQDGEWKPIETAPKDGGREILVFDDDSNQFVAYWSPLQKRFVDVMVGRRLSATHWQPLPAPPRL